MEIVTKSMQVERIAEENNLFKSDVENIVYNYITYLQRKLNEGESVKILNICYLNNPDSEGNIERNKETLGYISSEISDILCCGKNTVLGVLLSLEDAVIKSIMEDKSFIIRGLVRIRLNEDGRVRVRKSTKYTGNDMKVTVLPSFKRKVGVLVEDARKNS